MVGAYSFLFLWSKFHIGTFGDLNIRGSAKTHMTRPLYIFIDSTWEPFLEREKSLHSLPARFFFLRWHHYWRPLKKIYIREGGHSGKDAKCLEQIAKTIERYRGAKKWNKWCEKRRERETTRVICKAWRHLSRSWNIKNFKVSQRIDSVDEKTVQYTTKRVILQFENNQPFLLS